MVATRRRVALAVVVSYLGHLVAAQANLPDCARRCVTINASFQCDIDHIACICRNRSTQVRSCVSDICSGPVGDEQFTTFSNACRAAGAPLPGTGTTSTPPNNEPNPPTSSTPPPAQTSSPPPDDDNSSTRTTDPPPTSPGGSATRSSTLNPSNPSTTLPGGLGTSPTTSDGSQQTGPPSDDSNSDPQQQNNDGDKGGTSMGSLIGAVVGGLIGGLVVVAIVFCLVRRRRRQLEDDDDYGSRNIGNLGYLTDPKRDTFSTLTYPMDDLSSSDRSAYASPAPASRPLLSELPPGAAVPFSRGSPSVADSQGTYAARPLLLDMQASALPRKGDLPPVPSLRGPASTIAESVTTPSEGGSSSSAPPPGTATLASMGELTQQQLNLVQTMLNRGLPESAVVDVIQRMLVENAEVPPMYDGPSGSQPSGSGSGTGTELRAAGGARSSLVPEPHSQYPPDIKQ